MDLLEQLIQQRDQEEQAARFLVHETYRNRFLTLLRERPRKFLGDVYAEDPEQPGRVQTDEAGEPIPPVRYGPGRTVVCCPEPITFLACFQDCIDDQIASRQVMRELISGARKIPGVEFRRISLDHAPKDGMWFNSTQRGINLRPGMLDGDLEQPRPVPMNDLTVHGLAVGRTGSGKSVFLNNLIFNLLTEYPPWELDLYLADFKKVELSRYMTRYRTPHLKTCAATSEIRYVITMIEHLIACMQARQELLTRLGLQKLSDFRRRYGVVLPRVMLLVDEFQQLFQEATVREGLMIEEMLTSIVKLGRATGFHLLFASQEMSGTLSRKAMANFKIRFALPCESGVSMDVLGNSAASALERGFVLVNTESGKEEQNRRFRVPFIPDDEEAPEGAGESYFYAFLHGLCEEAERFGFQKNKTFYQEDSMVDMEVLEDILEKVKEAKRQELAAHKGRYVDIITLGHGVVYSDRRFDLETFYLERGRNKNILSLCPNVDDLAYVQKLLAVNLKHSVDYDRIQHCYFDFNPLISAKYSIAEDLPDIAVHSNPDLLSFIHTAYARNTAVEEAASEKSVAGFIQFYGRRLIEQLGRREAFQAYQQTMEEIFQGAELEQVPEICRRMLSGKDAQRALDYVQPVYQYYQHVREGKSWSEIFPLVVYWISGFEYIEELPRWFMQAMRNGLSANLLFLVFSASEDIRLAELTARSDYLFLSGNNEKMYARCGVEFTRKSRGSIVIDFKIKSLNTERSFKKFKVQQNRYEVPSLNFDLLL